MSQPDRTQSAAYTDEEPEFTQVSVEELEALLNASSKRAMRGLAAWFAVGIMSISAYMALALAGRPIWNCLPFLVLIAASIFVCGTAGALRVPRRRSRLSVDRSTVARRRLIVQRRKIMGWHIGVFRNDPFVVFDFGRVRIEVAYV